MKKILNIILVASVLVVGTNCALAKKSTEVDAVAKKEKEVVIVKPEKVKVNTKNELNAKLTDDEKHNRASQEQAQEIERLKTLLSQNTISSNKNVVNSVLMNSRDILGIDATDKDFGTFVDNITTEDDKKTSAIANYVSTIVKDAYEKGKQDATKDAMGNFGKNKGQGSKDNKGDGEIGELGKRIANTMNKKSQFDYFKQNKQ